MSRDRTIEGTKTRQLSSDTDTEASVHPAIDQPTRQIIQEMEAISALAREVTANKPLDRIIECAYDHILAVARGSSRSPLPRKSCPGGFERFSANRDAILKSCLHCPWAEGPP